ncbi:hypothetical protein ACFLSW_05595 [Candidatus Bipolaricaulota bacterium]
MLGHLEIMLRQYELLRSEINQCTLLRQAAVVGIFTTLVAGMGGLFVLRSDPLTPGLLQLGVIGVVFLVNAFGSLYLHEQHRNRRVCAFVLILERLLTKAASDYAISQGEGGSAVCPIMAWENFLAYSEASDRLNGPLYKARYLGVALPILVFGVPLIVATFSLIPNPELNLFWRGVPLLVSCVSVLLLIGFALWEASQKEKDPDKKRIDSRSRPLRLFLQSLYICPLPILAVYIACFPSSDIILSSGFSLPGYLLAGVAVVSTSFGFWSTYVFFGIMKWLSEEEQVCQNHPQQGKLASGPSDLGENDAALEESSIGRWLLSYCERIAHSSPEDLMLRSWSRFSKWKDNDAIERAGDND